MAPRRTTRFSSLAVNTSAHTNVVATPQTEFIKDESDDDSYQLFSSSILRKRTRSSSSRTNKPRSRPILVTRYNTADDEGTEWEETGLIVRLRFSKRKDALQKILVEAVASVKADLAQHHDPADNETTTIANPFIPSSTTNGDPQLRSPYSFESSIVTPGKIINFATSPTGLHHAPPT